MTNGCRHRICDDSDNAGVATVVSITSSVTCKTSKFRRSSTSTIIHVHNSRQFDQYINKPSSCVSGAVFLSSIEAEELGRSPFTVGNRCTGGIIRLLIQSTSHSKSSDDDGDINDGDDFPATPIKVIHVGLRSVSGTLYRLTFSYQQHFMTFSPLLYHISLSAIEWL